MVLYDDISPAQKIGIESQLHRMGELVKVAESTGDPVGFWQGTLWAHSCMAAAMVGSATAKEALAVLTNYADQFGRQGLDKIQ